MFKKTKMPFGGGFSTLLGPGVIIGDNKILLAPGQTHRINCAISEVDFIGERTATAEPAYELSEVDSKCTLEVGQTGVILNLTNAEKSVVAVSNLDVYGHLQCGTLIVPGILSVRKNAILNAKKIIYGTLKIEEGAIINATFQNKLSKEQLST